MEAKQTLPSFIYGTAWKEERTAELTRQALEAGFRAIDTANQRRHYHEAGVGEALRDFWREGRGTREELFLQTKYTFRPGHDHRLPYDPQASIGEQVAQSFRSSLEHLEIERLDSYLLHGPSARFGLAEADVEAWRAMEALAEAGEVRFLGVSNVSIDQLEELHRLAAIAPAFVQNRCFARDGWDAEVRAFCRAHGIAYQGFSLLTANSRELAKPVAARIAEAHRATVPQIVFAFARAVGMIPLTGTTSAEHMRDDLASIELALAEDEIAAIERLSAA